MLWSIFFGCSTTLFSLQSDPIRVVVSSPIQKDWVDFLGGDLIESLTILSPYNTPSTISLTPIHKKWIASSDLYIPFGTLSFEKEIADTVVSQNAQLMVLPLQKTDKQQSAQQYLSHVSVQSFYLLPPLESLQYVEAIFASFLDLRPQYAVNFQNAMNRYGYHLEFLNKKIKTMLDRYKGYVIASNSSYFNVFAETYGLTVKKIPLNKSIEKQLLWMKDHNVQAIVMDTYSNKKVCYELGKNSGVDCIIVDLFPVSYLKEIESFSLNLSYAFIRYRAFLNKKGTPYDIKIRKRIKYIRKSMFLL